MITDHSEARDGIQGNTPGGSLERGQHQFEHQQRAQAAAPSAPASAPGAPREPEQLLAP